jgi:CheY-like chemotaxis protein
MNFLFLDDNPERTKTARSCYPAGIYTETAKECIEKFQEKEDWDIVMLDHDLGGEIYVDSGREDCGMEVVRQICQNKKKVNIIIVHTLNHPAAEEMIRKLIDAGYKDVRRIPFTDKVYWQKIISEMKGYKDV